MVPLVGQWYHWLPMVALIKLPMVPLGEPRTEPLLGYVRLGKDEKYGGVVLGKNCFNKDIPLCYHEISLQFIQF